MSRLSLLVSVSAASILFLSAPASGMEVKASNDWNSAGLSGWTNSQTWISQNNPMAGGNTGGYQQVNFDATTWFSGEDYGLVTNQAANFYAGTWTTQMWFELDFWASNTAPVAVQVQWGASNDTGRTWSYQAFHETNATMATETWTGLGTVGLKDHTQWDQYDAGDTWTQGDFVSDLASIDWIGVYIWRSGIAAQDYGIDNFHLMVPEPAEIILLIVALSSAAVLLERRRRAELCAVVGDDVAPS